MDETQFWLAIPGAREDADEARLQSAAGTLRSAGETLSRYVVRPR